MEMPYNCLGDLYKSEVVSKLKTLGCDVKSVNALNKILEQMGLQIHSGNKWLTTEAGAKFTIYNCQVLNADAWHPAIVDEVFKYLTK